MKHVLALLALVLQCESEPMRIQVAVPEEHIEQPVLDSALEAVTRLNEAMIEQGTVPMFTDAIERVRWAPEPPGQECFDHAKTVLARGWGDCDDLAPWHAASLRVSGRDPGAIATCYQSGPNRWHAVVERSDGRIEDPSLSAGMPGKSRGAPASAVGMMDLGPSVGAYLLRPQIAMRPVYGEYQARAELPWQWEEHMMLDEPEELAWAMTTLHTAPVAATALTGSIMGLIELADAAGAGDPEHLQALHALAAAAEGCPYGDLVQTFGPEHADHAMAICGAFFRQINSYEYHPDTQTFTTASEPPLYVTGQKAIKDDPALGPFPARLTADYIRHPGPLPANVVAVIEEHWPELFDDHPDLHVPDDPHPGFLKGFYDNDPNTGKAYFENDPTYGRVFWRGEVRDGMRVAVPYVKAEG